MSFTRKGPGDFDPTNISEWWETSEDDGIKSGVSYEQYRALPGVNVSSLKELRRSPLHYRHRLSHPQTSDALTLGTAAHVATLEPHRYPEAIAVWDRKTETGRAAPRTGKAWESFVAEHEGRTTITLDEHETAQAIAAAVRSDPTAARYLRRGLPEVSMQWESRGALLKGRVDWLTELDGVDVVVGLKTTRDCRPGEFARQAYKLGYHMQWAYYHDGFRAVRGVAPYMVEIVVESAAPYAVAVYTIPEPVLSLGREEYVELLAMLRDCQTADVWPGPVPHETELTFPAWAYGAGEEITIEDAEV